MVKMVLMDLWEKRREAFKTVWKDNNMWGYMSVTIMVLVFLLSNIASHEIVKNDIVFSANYFFVLFVYIFHNMYPNVLPKVMYIMPLDEKQRAKYIKTLYLIKTGVFCVIYLCINIVLVGMKILDWKSALIMMVVMYMMMGILAGTMKANIDMENVKKKHIADIIVEIIVGVLCVFELVFFAEMKIEDVTYKGIIIFAFCGCVQLAFCVYIIKKNLEYMIALVKNVKNFR